MGDPRKFRNTYSGPAHPWQGERIQEEYALLNEFGLKNKTEVWRHNSKLKAFVDQAKQLIAATTAQAEKEKQQLMTRLVRLGLIQPGATLNDVLSVSLHDMLARRLQTIVVKRGLARTFKQARQYISHGHVKVADKEIRSPSYLISITEEGRVEFVPNSKLAKADHPERSVVPKPKKQRPQREEGRFGDRRFNDHRGADRGRRPSRGKFGGKGKSEGAESHEKKGDHK